MIWILIAIGVTCGADNPIFFCKSGTELPLEKVCDGSRDCRDGSDERKELCYHTICPSDKFKCNYGACIPRSYVCDKANNCADGSDESNCGRASDSCDPQEFRCDSGNCIASTLICDGAKNCPDNSDETSILCEHQLCPLDTFRCNFGGCVKLSSICNDFRDCADGSDESPALCKQGSKSAQRCPAVLTQRLNIYCHHDDDGVVDCREAVKPGTVARYSCRSYFEPISSIDEHNDQSICQATGQWSRDILKCKPECGYLPVALPLIVGGVETTPVPWHGSMFVHTQGTWKFWCGCSLISEALVLTAAHCVWQTAAQDIQLAFGEHQIKLPGSLAYRVKSVFVFPLYRDKVGNYASDIAVLEIVGSVDFSDNVHPVCVDWKLDDITSHLTHNSVGLVMGMGLTEEDKYSEVIRAVRLPVVSNEQCLEHQAEDFRKYVTFTAFCAGWTNGSGVCNGDSGGGLVFPQDYDGRWCIQGIVSLSPRRLSTSYCDPKKYTIFTKVGIYVKWIQYILEKVHATHNFTHTEYEPILNKPYL